MENPKAPSMDPLLHTIYFNRTKEQNDALGISGTVSKMINLKTITLLAMVDSLFAMMVNNSFIYVML